MKDVTAGDVVRFASKKCKRCRGLGYVKRWVYTDPDHMERQQLLCDCASKRFDKENAGKTETLESGAVVWKDEVMQ